MPSRISSFKRCRVADFAVTLNLHWVVLHGCDFKEYAVHTCRKKNWHCTPCFIRLFKHNPVQFSTFSFFSRSVWVFDDAPVFSLKLVQILLNYCIFRVHSEKQFDPWTSREEIWSRKAESFSWAKQNICGSFVPRVDLSVHGHLQLLSCIDLTGLIVWSGAIGIGLTSLNVCADLP